MSLSSPTGPQTAGPSVAAKVTLGRVLTPLVIGAAIALWPVPEGLTPSAWYYFALFVTVIAAIIAEPIPAAALGIPGESPLAWALLLGYPLGLMGILTSYASGQSAIYYGSGYISRRDFWALGMMMGLVFFSVYVVIIVPWLRFLGI